MFFILTLLVAPFLFTTLRVARTNMEREQMLKRARDLSKTYCG